MRSNPVWGVCSFLLFAPISVCVFGSNPWSNQIRLRLEIWYTHSPWAYQKSFFSFFFQKFFSRAVTIENQRITGICAYLLDCLVCIFTLCRCQVFCFLIWLNNNLAQNKISPPLIDLFDVNYDMRGKRVVFHKTTKSRYSKITFIQTNVGNKAKLSSLKLRKILWLIGKSLTEWVNTPSDRVS